MDGSPAIENNRAALLRIVAGLVAMAGWCLGQSSFVQPQVVATPSPQPAEYGEARRGEASPPAAHGEGEPLSTLTLPRHLRLAILRILRPAESAARRLAIALAAQLPPPAPTQSRPRKFKSPPLPQYFEISPANAVRPGEAHRKTGIVMASTALKRIGPDGTLLSYLIPKPIPATPQPIGRKPKPAAARLRQPSFRLLDPIRSPFRARRKSVPARSAPRIRSSGMLPSTGNPAALAPSSADLLNSQALARRIELLTAALGDLPGQARRFQRWQVRQAATRAHNARLLADAALRRRSAPAGIYLGDPPMRHGRMFPLKSGRPPGGRLHRWNPDAKRQSRTREIDEILAHSHDMALFALERRDSS